LAEVEGICDDVIIMNAGQVVAKGTVAEVIGQHGQADGQRAVRIRVQPASMESAQRALQAVHGAGRVTQGDAAGGWLVVEMADGAGASSADDPAARNRLLGALIQADIPVLGFETAGGRLQDVFLQLTAEAIE